MKRSQKISTFLLEEDVFCDDVYDDEDKENYDMHWKTKTHRHTSSKGATSSGNNKNHGGEGGRGGRVYQLNSTALAASSINDGSGSSLVLSPPVSLPSKRPFDDEDDERATDTRRTNEIESPSTASSTKYNNAVGSRTTNNIRYRDEEKPDFRNVHTEEKPDDKLTTSTKTTRTSHDARTVSTDSGVYSSMDWVGNITNTNTNITNKHSTATAGSVASGTSDNNRKKKASESQQQQQQRQNYAGCSANLDGTGSIVSAISPGNTRSPLLSSQHQTPVTPCSKSLIGTPTYNTSRTTTQSAVSVSTGGSDTRDKNQRNKQMLSINCSSSNRTTYSSNSISANESMLLNNLNDQQVPVTPKNTDSAPGSFSITPVVLNLRELQLRSGGVTPCANRQQQQQQQQQQYFPRRGFRSSPYTSMSKTSYRSSASQLLNRSSGVGGFSASSSPLSKSFLGGSSSPSALLSSAPRRRCYGGIKGRVTAASTRSSVYDRSHTWPSKRALLSSPFSKNSPHQYYYQQQQERRQKKQLFPMTSSTMQDRHHRRTSSLMTSPPPGDGVDVEDDGSNNLDTSHNQQQHGFHHSTLLLQQQHQQQQNDRTAMLRSGINTNSKNFAPRSRVSPVVRSPYGSGTGRSKLFAWRSSSLSSLSSSSSGGTSERSVFKSLDNIESSYNDLLPSPLK